MRSPPTPPPPPAPAVRRKPSSGPAVREWAVVSADGATRREAARRHSVMLRTGLPARDLRVLDPLLSHPSTILGRERAVVVNLEHVKAAITAAEVLVPCSKERDVEPLVRALAARVSASPGPARPKDAGSREMPWGDGARKGLVTLEELLVLGDDDTRQTSPASTPPASHGGDKALPFEFRALEVCLESACNSLESETCALEKEAYPALDELTSKVSTLNLERIRQIKSRFVALAGRVQKVRDELEHLLEDDLDMAAMHLSGKAAYKEAYGSLSSRFDLDQDAASQLGEERCEDAEGVRTESGKRSSGSGFRPNTQELEMLLEAYFVQIEGTLNKLSILNEYMNDTEDYINIMLDEKQNQLLQMGVVLTTATMIATITVIVSGFLSINIHIPLYETTSLQFWEATGGLLVAGVALFAVAYVWYKKSGLLQ